MWLLTRWKERREALEVALELVFHVQLLWLSEQKFLGDLQSVFLDVVI